MQHFDVLRQASALGTEVEGAVLERELDGFFGHTRQLNEHGGGFGTLGNGVAGNVDGWGVR